MPRRTVKTYYRKAQRPKPRRGRRKAVEGAPVETVVAGPLTRLAQYIEENAVSGLDRDELHQQFHEFDCDGEMVLLSQSPKKRIVHCEICKYVVVTEIA